METSELNTVNQTIGNENNVNGNGNWHLSDGKWQYSDGNTIDRYPTEFV